MDLNKHYMLNAILGIVAKYTLIWNLIGFANKRYLFFLPIGSNICEPFVCLPFFSCCLFDCTLGQPFMHEPDEWEVKENETNDFWLHPSISLNYTIRLNVDGALMSNKLAAKRSCAMQTFWCTLLTFHWFVYITLEIGEHLTRTIRLHRLLHAHNESSRFYSCITKSPSLSSLFSFFCRTFLTSKVPWGLVNGLIDWTMIGL